MPYMVPRLSLPAITMPFFVILRMYISRLPRRDFFSDLERSFSMPLLPMVPTMTLALFPIAAFSPVTLPKSSDRLRAAIFTPSHSESAVWITAGLAGVNKYKAAAARIKHMFMQQMYLLQNQMRAN